MPRSKKGTPDGDKAVEKWRKTMIEKYGSVEGYREQLKKLSAKGGRNGYGPDYKGGYASNPAFAKICGYKGGRISRRGYKFVKEANGKREYINKETGAKEYVKTR